MSNIAPSIGTLPNLTVIPWGGVTKDGIKLTNTCPVDNWLMIFQTLVKSGTVDVNHLDNAGNILKTALSLVDNHEYGESKVVFMPVPPVVNNGLIDLYGNESDYLIKVLQPVLATAVTTSCNLPLCPSSVSTYKSYGIALGANIKDNT